MVAYEFYLRERRDPMETEVFHLIGILPERRRNPSRITGESIMNWGRTILGEKADLTNLFFSQMTINEATGEISYPQPSVRGGVEA